MQNRKSKQMIDIHCHILPGIDDGARDLKESVKLVLMAASQGIDGVIATPHYSRRKTRRDYEILLSQVREAVGKLLPDFPIYLGQELMYHQDLGRMLMAGQALTLADSSYILVEFDDAVPFSLLYRGIRELFEYGYTPILAHMERYACLRKAENLRELKSIDCLFQMNYESLEGRWYQQDVKWCRKRVTAGEIHFMGSDMHRVDHRPPDITEAVKWIEHHVEEEVCSRLLGDNAERILQDDFIR